MHEDEYRLERVGVLMEGRSDEPAEAWGVLNPASARSPDGVLYLFPRIVADHNFSRIGFARVVFDEGGTPAGVERLGYALEPEEQWERNAATAGTEDPRITYLERLGAYVMAYSAYGPLRSRIGLAWSQDLQSWERLGPASFDYDPRLGTDLNLYPNKDGVLFPEPVRAPDGQMAYAMLHRPMWDLGWVRPGEGVVLPSGIDDERPGIWVSFAPVADVEADPFTGLTRFGQHRLVALPRYAWEQTKIGAGTPPVRTPAGWLTIHHGVTGTLVPDQDLQPNVSYSAGLMIHDLTDVTAVTYRSPTPLLTPETPGERHGLVPNVCFPTAIDIRDGQTWIFYGMADSRIGVARLTPPLDG